MSEEKEKSNPELESEDKTLEIISNAEKVAERLEQANKIYKENLKKQEILLAKERLGGKSDAGSQKKSKDEIETEHARSLLKGTGFEDELFPRK